MNRLKILLEYKYDETDISHIAPPATAAEGFEPV